jgi:hypothetical protein
MAIVRPEYNRSHPSRGMQSLYPSQDPLSYPYNPHP